VLLVRENRFRNLETAEGAGASVATVVSGDACCTGCVGGVDVEERVPGDVSRLVD